MRFRTIAHHGLWYVWPALSVERWANLVTVSLYVWTWGVEVEWER